MSERLDGRVKWHVARHPWVENGVHIAHGKSGSSMIRKDEVNGWRTASGLLFVAGKYMLWIYWRNWR